MEKLRVTVLFNTAGPPPADQDYSKDLESGEKQAEYDIHMALVEAGYDSRLLGVHSNVNDLLDGIRAQKPDLVFNTCEAFQRKSALEMNVAALLEMLGVPYTGSPPAALILGRDKALAKKILLFHQLQVPRFGVCPRGQPVNGFADLAYPMIVKPIAEDGSKGIAQTSVVKERDALTERVAFVHQSMAQDALVEEMIEGREIYIGVLGNESLQVLPLIEMRFDKMTGSRPKIASYRAKWDPKFRERHGIENVFPTDLAPELIERLEETGRTAYRALNLRDYARIDVRVTPDGQVFVLEANPNPYLAYGEDMADAAERAGMSYPQFISRIVELAWERRPKRRRSPA